MQAGSPQRVRTFNDRGPVHEVTLAEAQAATVALARRLRRLEAAPAASLAGARGGVLAEDVRADRDAPPFRRAMRDGYALRSSEGSAARRCVGEVAAGREHPGELPAGTCVAIMTGAPVPAGADAVAMVEHTRVRDGCVEPTQAPRAGDHIAPAGSDTPVGGIVAAAGRRVDAATLGALASVGCLQPQLFRPPRVAVLSTGDELVAADASPAAAQIRDSNGPMLAALAEAAGAEVVWRQRQSDRGGEIAAALRNGVRNADMVVTSGGASVGAHDALGEVLAALGAEPAFDAVRIRPGRPVRCAALDGRLVLALPGNPVGAWLAFELLARPALEVWSGLEQPTPRLVSAELGFAWRRSQPLPLIQFLPVRMRAGWLDEVPYHGSADLAAAATADGFLLVPENTTELARGSQVKVLLK